MQVRCWQASRVSLLLIVVLCACIVTHCGGLAARSRKERHADAYFTHHYSKLRGEAAARRALVHLLQAATLHMQNVRQVDEDQLVPHIVLMSTGQRHRLSSRFPRSSDVQDNHAALPGYKLHLLSNHPDSKFSSGGDMQIGTSFTGTSNSSAAVAKPSQKGKSLQFMPAFLHHPH